MDEEFEGNDTKAAALCRERGLDPWDVSLKPGYEDHFNLDWARDQMKSTRAGE